MNSYKVQVLKQILNEMKQDEYYLCKLKGDGTAPINLDEKAIKLLIEHYSKQTEENMERKYWTKDELIEYFKQLAYEFEVEAHRNNDMFAKGKAEAYSTVAFEIEHNTKEI